MAGRHSVPAVALASALTLYAAVAAGQGRVTLDFQGTPAILVRVPIEQIPTLLTRLHPLDLDGPSVRTAADMSERAARMVLKVSPRQCVGALTLAESAGDTLFGAWKLDDGDGPNTLAVWDTPRYSAFVLIWTRVPFAGGGDAVAFTKSISPPGTVLGSAELRLRWDAVGRRLDGWGTPPLTPRPHGFEIQVLGAPAGDIPYVYEVIVGKSLLARAYTNGEPSDSFLVPERFPPLRERLAGWTKGKLLAELSDGFDDFAANRDEILVQELLRRGLSTVEFQQLFAAPGPFRVENVMQALAGAGLIAQYGAGLREVLLAQSPGVHRSEEIVRIALRYLQASADPDVCDVVSEFLARGIFAPWTFAYMERRGHTHEHYIAVERAAAPAGASELARSRALDQIRRRIPGLGGR
jgi:hypothetical protein